VTPGRIVGRLAPGHRGLIVTLACGLVLGPGPAAAQSPPRVARVGYLSTVAGTRYVAAVQERLRELGWVERQNLASEHRDAAGRPERLRDLAAELVRSRVDVVVAMETQAAHAARAAARDIPVVFATSDPRGLVENLARPGGNLTGVTNIGTDIAGKQLELLVQMVPGATRGAALARADSPATAPFVKEVEAAARALGLRFEVLPVRDAAGIEAALRGLARPPVDVLLVQADTLFFRERRRIVDVAASRRVPALYGAREFPEAGGLMSYGTNLPALYRQLGDYVDRILRGARPGGLPVAQPTTFEIVVNARAAKALGLPIPPALRLRADQVLE
jgi:putative ABC transport system substrate-binding protein